MRKPRWTVFRWIVWGLIVILRLFSLPKSIENFFHWLETKQLYLSADTLSWAIILLLAIAFLAIDIGPWLYDRIKFRHKLSKTQEQIILYLGGASSDFSATYQNVLSKCNIEDKSKEEIHGERVRLVRYGLAEYLNGTLMLTDKGFEQYERLIKQGKEFRPKEDLRDATDTLKVDIKPLSGLQPIVVELEDSEVEDRMFVVPNILIVNRTGRNISCEAKLVVKGSIYHDAKMEEARIEPEQWKEKYSSNYGTKILNTPIDIEANSSISGCLVFGISSYELEHDLMLFGWADRRKKPHYLRLTDMHRDEVREVRLFYRVRMSYDLDETQEDVNS